MKFILSILLVITFSCKAQYGDYKNISDSLSKKYNVSVTSYSYTFCNNRESFILNYSSSTEDSYIRCWTRMLEPTPAHWQNKLDSISKKVGIKICGINYKYDQNTEICNIFYQNKSTLDMEEKQLYKIKKTIKRND